jgi:hypothetical protein
MPLRLATLVLVALVFLLPGRAEAMLPWYYPLLDQPRLGALERIPVCTDGDMLARVVEQFNETENTYWNGRQRMTGIVHARGQGLHPRRDGKIARRWCGGTATFADGRQRRVVIELAADAGFVGVGYGLAFCVVGLPRSWTFQPACRVLRHREF